MGLDKGKCPSFEGPYACANMLNRIPSEVDLDLEIIMSVRLRQRWALGLVTNIEVVTIASLEHTVCFTSRSYRH